MKDLNLVVRGADAPDRAPFSENARFPRVDDWPRVRGIIFVIRNGLRWRDVPAAYGPRKTINNRFIRELDGHVQPDFRGPGGQGGKQDQLMFGATHLDGHPEAASPLKKGLLPDV